mmetsp:Transcript_11280/g.23929  ORF Transcript_11280/g.23929 Transcript_11280/m.23929 type:complete len:292 (-) Transcript_11280:296-1171(-)
MKSLIQFPQEVAVGATPSPQALALAFPSPSASASCSALIAPNENIANGGRDTNTKHNSFDDLGSDCDSDSDSDADETTSETDSSSTIEDIGTHEIITCSSDCCACKNRRVQPKRVSFGPIHVRQYERIVGDHPETKVGVPLAIGWAYYEDEKHPQGVSIERYESDGILNRWAISSKNNYSTKPSTRTNNRRVRMTSITRRNMLLNVFGIPLEEIRRAEKETIRRQLRKRSSNGEQAVSKAEAICKKVSKTIRKKGISFLKGMAYAAQIGASGGVDGIGSQATSSRATGLSF